MPSLVALSVAGGALPPFGWARGRRQREARGGREAEREPGRGNQSEMDERLSEPSFVPSSVPSFSFLGAHDRFNRNSTGHAAIAADPTPILSAS